MLAGFLWFGGALKQRLLGDLWVDSNAGD